MYDIERLVLTSKSCEPRMYYELDNLAGSKALEPSKASLLRYPCSWL